MNTVRVGKLELAFRAAGDSAKPTLLLLHGWPHSSAIYSSVMDELGRDQYVLAFDLPAIGASRGAPPSGEASVHADILLSAAEAVGGKSTVIAGLDFGGMIAFAAAREHASRIAGAVVMSTVIPGVDPWPRIIADPHVWHFAFHGIPELPEALVAGRERRYFDFFFDFLAQDKQALTEALRNEMTGAYTTPESLHAGFEWYRALPRDAKRNSESRRIDVPLLYVRGDADGRPIEDYVEGCVAPAPSI